MRLEGMTIGPYPAMIDHQRWQEMILDVRVCDLFVGADKGASLEMSGSTEPAPEQQPLDPHTRHGDGIEGAVERNRLSGFILNLHFDVILQVLPDARQIVQDRNSDLLEMRSRSDAR